MEDETSQSWIMKLSPRGVRTHVLVGHDVIYDVLYLQQSISVPDVFAGRAVVRFASIVQQQHSTARHSGYTA